MHSSREQRATAAASKPYPHMVFAISQPLFTFSWAHYAYAFASTPLVYDAAPSVCRTKHECIKKGDHKYGRRLPTNKETETSESNTRAGDGPEWTVRGQ